MLPLCLMPKNVTVCHSKNNCVQIPIRTSMHFLRFLALKIKSVWILKMSVHLKGLCRLSRCYYTHGCLLLFLSFARVVEWLWRSPWNWASGTPLTFASTRNNAELQWKEVIWDNALLKPTRKYARFVLLFANMYTILRGKADSCFHSDSTFRDPRKRHHVHFRIASSDFFRVVRIIQHLKKSRISDWLPYAPLIIEFKHE